MSANFPYLYFLTPHGERHGQTVPLRHGQLAGSFGTDSRGIPPRHAICLGDGRPAFSALLIYNLVFPSQPPLTTRDVKDTVVQVMASATPRPSFSAQVYEVVQPSLVLIETRTKAENGEVDQSLGSGVVVDQQGDILTSLHVVAGASEIFVIYADGTQSKAQILLAQPENDIAVLFPDRLPSVLVPAVIGDPNAMRVGDDVYAVGNPFGLYSSMSAGVISGFNRSFQPVVSLLRAVSISKGGKSTVL